MKAACHFYLQISSKAVEKNKSQLAFRRELPWSVSTELSPFPPLSFPLLHVERIKRRSPPWGQPPLEESVLDSPLPIPFLFFLGTGSLWLPTVTLGDRGVGVCGCPCLEEGASRTWGAKKNWTRRGGIKIGRMLGKGSGGCFSLSGEQNIRGNSPSAQELSPKVAASAQVSTPCLPFPAHKGMFRFIVCIASKEHVHCETKLELSCVNIWHPLGVVGGQ